jgi:hypothetical protein
MEDREKLGACILIVFFLVVIGNRACFDFTFSIYLSQGVLDLGVHLVQTPYCTTICFCIPSTILAKWFIHCLSVFMNFISNDIHCTLFYTTMGR